MELWADVDVAVKDEEGCPGVLKARVLMALPPGAYPLPDLTSLRTAPDVWLRDWLTKSGLIRRGDTGEEILEKAKAMCAGSALFLPLIPPTSPRLHIYTYFFALAVFMDDVVEGKNLLGREMEKGLQVAGLGGEIILGKFSAIADLPPVYPVVMPIFKALFLASREARNTIPAFSDNCADFVTATNESFLGMTLMQLEDSLRLPIPDDYFLFLRRHDAGCEAFIQLAALVMGVALPSALKSNLLLVRLLQLASSITAHVNDLFGVATDLAKGEGFSLVMFKARSATLRDAFREVNDLVEEETRNFIGIARRLRWTYPEEGALDQFIRVVEHIVDGHVHYCVLNKKYAHVGVTFRQADKQDRNGSDGSELLGKALAATVISN